MVTLLGFFFILGNVGLLVLYDPELIGNVCQWLRRLRMAAGGGCCRLQYITGTIMAFLQLRGWYLDVRERPWPTAGIDLFAC